MHLITQEEMPHAKLLIHCQKCRESRKLATPKYKFSSLLLLYLLQRRENFVSQRDLFHFPVKKTRNKMMKPWNVTQQVLELEAIRVEKNSGRSIGTDFNMGFTAKQGDAILKQALGIAPPGSENAAAGITRSRALTTRAFLIVTASLIGFFIGVSIGRNVEKMESRTRAMQIELPDPDIKITPRRRFPVASSTIPRRHTLKKKLLSSMNNPKTFADCKGNGACCNRLGGAEWNHHIIASADMLSGNRYRRIAVYPRGDVLSGDVRRIKIWESQKTKHLLTQLKKLGSSAVFLDVGANIGWFSLAAAYAGHRVIAVEPHRDNVELFRHSLCLAPPEVRARITLLPYGLGTRDGAKCELWQRPSVNRGDTVTVCAPQSRAALVQDMRDTNYVKLGVVHLKSLDALIRKRRIKMLKGDKVILKLRVEGYEPYAWEGMRSFIRKMRPSVVYTEFCRYSIMRAAHSMNWSEKRARLLPDKYLQYLKDAGYKFKKPRGGPGVVHDMTLVRP